MKIRTETEARFHGSIILKVCSRRGSIIFTDVCRTWQKENKKKMENNDTQGLVYPMGSPGRHADSEGRQVI